MAMLRHKCINEGGGILAMLRHKGWWWDISHVKA